MDAERSSGTVGASRAAVLQILRAAPAPMTVDAVAAAMGLTVATVRFHLDHLRHDGLISTVKAPSDGPGRPRLLYRAAAPEAVDGAAAYQLLAGLLADQLLQGGDTGAPVAAGRRWADRLGETGAVVAAEHGLDDDLDAAAGPGAHAVRTIVNLFDDGGFAPRLSDDGRTVALHRCPFMALAAQKAEVVCAVHLGLLRGVLERLDDEAVAEGRPRHEIRVDAVKLRPVLDGSGPCLVHFPAARRPCA